MDILVQIFAFVSITLLIVFLIALFMLVLVYGTFIAIAVPLLLIAGICYGIYLLCKKQNPELDSGSDF